MTIDLSKPHPGRIYDYLMGGNHNFEVDRVAGDRMRQSLPELAKWMRLNRWFLYYAIEQLISGGFTGYLDLGSGIPTQGYLHEQVPANSRIIYTDNDPLTVEYSRDLIADQPLVRYIEADVRHIEPILQAADTFFSGDRRIGICLVGVSYFLADDELQELLRRLYDWVAPGSWLALSFANFAFAGQPTVHAEYQRMGTALYDRSEGEILRLSAPWLPRSGGLQSLEIFAEQLLQTPVEIEKIGEVNAMFGGLFEKPSLA